MKRMSKEIMYRGMSKIIDKYVKDENTRISLMKLLEDDEDSLKYVLSEIDKQKKEPYSKNDISLIQEIYFNFC